MDACVKHHRAVHPCKYTGNIALYRTRNLALAQWLTIGNFRCAQRALHNGGNDLCLNGVSTGNEGDCVIATQCERTLRDSVGFHNILICLSSQRTGEHVISKQLR